MPLINWDQSCSVEVKEIDAQHQKMFGIINRLYDLMQENKDAQNLPQVFQELTDYANYHFSTEEKYFKEFNYEKQDAHIAAHKTYTEKIAQLIKDYPNKKDTTSFELINFLENWWLDHINGMDKQYTECFHNHGLD